MERGFPMDGYSSSSGFGVGRVIQIGVRAYSHEEEEAIQNEDRVEAWFARDLLSIVDGRLVWESLVERVSSISGPVWLTFDVDGLDGSLVPATGTPVPGGLSHWGSVELIENLFASGNCEVVGADVNEIVPGTEGSLTEFSAALIATKIVACHIANSETKIGE